jgi:cbb3-type cytochrome oxidase maturation protein
VSVIFIVLPLAILVGAAGLAAFIWAVKTGQFDDLDTPAVRVLFDDEDGAERKPGQTDREGADRAPDSDAGDRDPTAGAR